LQSSQQITYRLQLNSENKSTHFWHNTFKTREHHVKNWTDWKNPERETIY
jgi:hypothetical protein